MKLLKKLKELIKIYKKYFSCAYISNGSQLQKFLSK